MIGISWNHAEVEIVYYVVLNGLGFPCIKRFNFLQQTHVTETMRQFSARSLLPFLKTAAGNMFFFQPLYIWLSLRDCQNNFAFVIMGATTVANSLRK